MSTAAPLQALAAKPQPLSNSTHAGLLLQRKCACGSPTSSLTGECAECKSNKRLQAKLTIGASNDPLEREADRVADRVLAAPAHPAVSAAPPRIQRFTGHATGENGMAPASVDRVLAGPGRPLDAALRQDMEQRFGYDFSRVRVHSGLAAEQSALDVNSNAYTVGKNIVFRAGQYTPGTQDGRRLIAHELTHVVQQSGSDGIHVGQSNENRGLSPISQQSASDRIARKTLTDLPETTRKSLQISRGAPPLSEVEKWIKNYFDPKSGIRISSGITTEFGTEITDTNQQKGLRSIAIELVSLSSVVVTPATKTEPEQRSNTDPENWPLPTNSIIDLSLDLRLHGGEHAIFRFTHFAEGGTDKVLIEKTQVLAAATPAGTVQAPAGQPQVSAGSAASFTGTVSVGNIKVMIDNTFSNDRGKVIADAVQLLPDAIRAEIDGVTISFAGSGKGPSGQNGEYKAEDDKVRLWGDVFEDSPRRAGAATNTAYQIVHELGHAVDLRPRFKAQRARDKAEAAKKILVHDRDFPPIKIDSKDPLAGLEGENDSARQAEKKRLQGEIDKMNKEIQAQNTAMENSKSIAGGELGKDTEKLLTDFGKALKADGVEAAKNAKKRNLVVDTANEKAAKDNAADPTGRQQPMKSNEKALSKGISNYAATDLMEAFAENFSAYVLDEALLKAIRPKTHAYFAKAFPKTTGVKP